MANYKILETRINEDVSTSILNKNTGIICPKCTGNKEYDQFIQDVKDQGIVIVEGPDVVTPDYKQQRLAEYPSLVDQQDMQYWDAVNGSTTWKDKINEIKTKYPKTNTGSTTVGDVPSWVQTQADKLNS
mgnify:CR=1 FL=1